MKSRFLVAAIVFACAPGSLVAQTQQVIFNFVGAAQTWVVPNGVTSVAVDARGAQGSSSGTPGAPNPQGGKGGRVQTTLAVRPAETLVIYVGGRGGDLIPPNTAGPGGFNGGGTGGIDNVDFNGPAGGGGGASDVRQGSNGLANRVVVAGGGGAAECCGDANGGDGGGTTGMAGGTSGGGSAPGSGGTQTIGGAGGSGCNGNGGDGSLGQGGVGGNGNRAGGGGGGGYYGGGGGGGCTFGSGGGGGSSYSAGTNTIHTQGYQPGDGQVIITLTGSSAAAQQTVLFAGINVSPVVYLDDQTRLYIDSRGRTHTYHVFAIANNANKALFSILLAAESSGSVVRIEVPSGGNPGDTDSGGAVQALLPFGLTVSQITGYNVDFGQPTAANPVIAAFKCEFLGEINAILSSIGNLATGGLFSTFQRARSCGFITPIPVAGDACDVIYPIINPASADCLKSEIPTALYGDNALNTHQIRNISWKPDIDGVTFSRIEFHVNESSDTVISLIKQKGITVYVHTPVGDYFLDNFR